MEIDLGPYDCYTYSFLAAFGTFAGAWFLHWMANRSAFAPVIHTFRGVAPPFLSVIGVLFALNLVFLANDTWRAHDRAFDSVYQEANTLRAILTFAEHLPAVQRSHLETAIAAYVAQVVEVEWKTLGQRESSPAAAAALETLLTTISGTDFAEALGPSVHSLMLQQAIQVRTTRSALIAVGQSRINPLKWLSMAVLGLLMMISIVVVHIDQPRAEIAAVLLFAAASGPSAAVVLIQSNPFQQPSVVSAAPLSAVLHDLPHDRSLPRPIP